LLGDTLIHDIFNVIVEELIRGSAMSQMRKIFLEYIVVILIVELGMRGLLLFLVERVWGALLLVLLDVERVMLLVGSFLWFLLFSSQFLAERELFFLFSLSVSVGLFFSSYTVVFSSLVLFFIFSLFFTLLFFVSFFL
jgi:hypothetical protein